MANIDNLLRKVQAIELEILNTFLCICAKYELRYFLIGGSALGAVRHAGFIPWDDDIDVGMPRPDYRRFLEVAIDELPGHMFLQTYMTEKLFHQNFAKIRHSETAFVENSIAHLRINHGIYIDIFPIDGFDAYWIYNERIRYNIFRCLRALIMAKLGVKASVRGSPLLRLASSVIPLNSLRATLEWIAAANDYDSATKVINWYGTWGMREAIPKSMLGGGAAATFEGVSVVIPQDYDGYLRALYDDYMKLPPHGKRVSHHFVDIVDVHHSYVIYQDRKS
jgi:lipopolysaccharide cholinephosphotransferase